MNNNDDQLNQDQESEKGFASMPKEEVSEVGKKGGKAAHEKDTVLEFDSEEAGEAGRKDTSI